MAGIWRDGRNLPSGVVVSVSQPGAAVCCWPTTPDRHQPRLAAPVLIRWSYCMCGVTGIVTRSPIDLRGRIDAMTDALAHRGPDDRGVAVVAPQGVGLRLRPLP